MLGTCNGCGKMQSVKRLFENEMYEDETYDQQYLQFVAD
jgi:hypothetical protein